MSSLALTSLTGHGSLPVAVNTFPLVHRLPAAEAIRRLAEVGHRRFEIACAPGHLWPSELDSAARRRLLSEWRAEGTEVVSLNPSSLDQNIAGAAPETREHTLVLLRAILGLAADLEVPLVVLPAGRVNPLLTPPREQVRRWLRDGVAGAVKLARGAGVQLLLENIPFGALPLAEDLVAVIDEVNDPALALAYDVANARFVGERPEIGIRTIGARLRLVHLADTGLNAWRHDPLGRGVVAFDRIATALRDIGFEGESVIEVTSVVPERDLAASHHLLVALGWKPLIAAGVDDRTQFAT
jgi:sugar phosphate isomerase/epimerase